MCLCVLFSLYLLCFVVFFFEEIYFSLLFSFSLCLYLFLSTSVDWMAETENPSPKSQTHREDMWLKKNIYILIIISFWFVSRSYCCPSLSTPCPSFLFVCLGSFLQGWMLIRLWIWSSIRWSDRKLTYRITECMTESVNGLFAEAVAHFEQHLKNQRLGCDSAHRNDLEFDL